jgi:Raf kinase inhibitor-like YbhB/YbcL family protein
MNLVSPAFAEGAQIPQKFSRLGDNVFPPLKWSGAPVEARSYVLMVEDPDAPSGTFRHCGVFNIPADWTELPESADTMSGAAPRFAENDFGNIHYDGPQPPKGHGVHHYHFRIAALDVPDLSVPASAGVEAMWREAKKHTLSQASLMGTFEVH